MSISSLEAFLARIYVDPQSRDRFLSNPAAEAFSAGLAEDEVEALKQIDRVGLELFAASLERKRQLHDCSGTKKHKSHKRFRLR